MNVLQLRTEFSDNGPGTQCLTISEELRKRGHNVFLASSGGYLTTKILDKGFKYFIIKEIAFGKRSFFNVVTSIYKIYKILKNNKIDVVHAHNAASISLANIASLFIFRKIKFFQSVRGVEMRKSFFWRNWIYKLNNYNALFAVSNYTKNVLKSFGVNSNKIIVTHNGVDTLRFNILKKKKYSDEIKKEFNIPSDSVIIGIVGRQDGTKGHKDLVLAFKKLYNIYENVYVVLVGEGKAMQKNIDLSKKLGIDDRCIFTGLRLDVEKLHASFDIFTLLSLKGMEMFPNVILESMSYGNPFVGTNTTGVPEAAENGEGFICEPNDIEDIANRLNMLVKSKKLRNSMGKSARKSIENKFNINNVVSSIEKGYLDM